MAKEIERKFLVRDESYKTLATERRELVQAYLSADPKATVRVRIADGRGYLTVKGRNSGAVRDEWEYEIPARDAEEMIERCSSGTVITKTRHIIPAGKGLKWDVDEFHGAHEGLVVAEIELPDKETTFPLPEFIGREVTGDARYYNSSLSASGAAGAGAAPRS